MPGLRKRSAGAGVLTARDAKGPRQLQPPFAKPLDEPCRQDLLVECPTREPDGYGSPPLIGQILSTEPQQGKLVLLDAGVHQNA